MAIGEVLGLVGKGLEAFVGSRNADKANEMRAQQAAMDRKLQMDFAQHGIKWKVDDALESGVHPLFALGASTHSYSNTAFSPEVRPTPRFGDMGQDVGRAIHATSTAQERATSAASAALALERGKLENDLLRTQIASQAAKLRGQVGPAMPSGQGEADIPGQGPTVRVRPFISGEEKKVDDRPQLGYGGRKWLTDPGTVNMQKTEDRYGDDGPLTWLFQIITGWNDLKHNVDSGNLTRGDAEQWLRDELRWIDRHTKVFGR